MGGKVAAVLLWIIRSIVLLLWLMLILTFFAHKLTIPWHADAPGVGGIVLSALPFMVLFTVVFFFVDRRIKRPVEAVVLVVLLISGSFLLALPYPAVDTRYTADDLALPPNVEASSETLMRYAMDSEAVPSSGLDADIKQLSGTWPNLLPYREEIETAWNQFDAGHQFINDLNEFPGIGRPYESVISSESKIQLNYTLLREAGQLYGLHALLQVQQGQMAEGIQDLATMHSVAIKALPYQNVIIEKMVFASVASMTIRAAYHIVQHGECTHEELKLLLDHFPPLEVRHTSIRRSIMDELLLMQEMTDAVDAAGNRHVVALLYDRHQTMAEIQSYGNVLLEQANSNEWQVIKEAPRIPPWMRMDYLWLYPRNLMAHMLYAISSPQLFTKCSAHMLKLKVQSDLLALELHQILDRPLVLKDVYGEESYRHDEEQQQYFSVGPDGKPHTEDDIYIEQDCK